MSTDADTHDRKEVVSAPEKEAANGFIQYLLERNAQLQRRIKAFQEGYRDKAFEVTALEIQILDLKAHGVDKVTARQNESLKTKLLAACIERNEAKEVARCAQAVLTALNVGDVQSESPLHKKLREVMIAYRAAAATTQPKESQE